MRLAKHDAPLRRAIILAPLVTRIRAMWPICHRRSLALRQSAAAGFPARVTWCQWSGRRSAASVANGRRLMKVYDFDFVKNRIDKF